MGGDVSDAVLLETETPLAEEGQRAYGDYADFDLPLTELANRTLAPGQSITIKIRLEIMSPIFSFLDNVVLTGTQE